MKTANDTYAAIRKAQESGKVVALVDMAHTFDVFDALDSGVTVARMLVSQPDTEGQGADVCEALVRSGAVDLLIILGGCPSFIAEKLIRLGERSGITVSIAPRWDETETFPDLMATTASENA